MATVQSLADRLRSELGDIGRSFVETSELDGSTKRIELRHAPLDGANLVISLDGTDISDDCTIEEHTGVLTLPAVPDPGSVLTVAGTHYRYFTNVEVAKYVEVAFLEHSSMSSTEYGAKYTYSNLPAVEEYPVVLLASSLALFTLATDAAFDIDIMAPDGVTIPRSQRYRQLMEMVQQRKEQYREMCNLLGIGLYGIQVFNLRRISQRTNRYSPVYRPQEVDDSSRPQRLRIPIPTYGAAQTSSVQQLDITITQGDSYSFVVDFPFDITGYEFLAQIRQYAGGPIALAQWDVEVVDAVNGQIRLSLGAQASKQLPDRSVWDLQLTVADDPDFQKTWVRGNLIAERQVSTVNSDPYAPGWRG